MFRLCASLLLCFFAASASASTGESVWRFQVFLDDKPIGEHRFTLVDDGEVKRLTSKADFDVKVLMFTAYEYDHRAEEVWRDGCLAAIEANTTANDARYVVRGEKGEQGFTLTRPQPATELPACIMTFAYWNPAMLEEQRLLNAQTGEYLPIRVTREGEETLDTVFGPRRAERYSIETEGQTLYVWYDKDSRDWLALESPTKRDAKLIYKRRLLDAAHTARSEY